MKTLLLALALTVGFSSITYANTSSDKKVVTTQSQPKNVSKRIVKRCGCPNIKVINEYKFTYKGRVYTNRVVEFVQSK